jgi:hypothetical protein
VINFTVEFFRTMVAGGSRLSIGVFLSRGWRGLRGDLRPDRVKPIASSLGGPDVVT